MEVSIVQFSTHPARLEQFVLDGEILGTSDASEVSWLTGSDFVGPSATLLYPMVAGVSSKNFAGINGTAGYFFPLPIPGNAFAYYERTGPVSSYQCLVSCGDFFLDPPGPQTMTFGIAVQGFNYYMGAVSDVRLP
jgi:hypothetical protein